MEEKYFAAIFLHKVTICMVRFWWLLWSWNNVNLLASAWSAVFCGLFIILTSVRHDLVLSNHLGCWSIASHFLYYSQISADISRMESGINTEISSTPPHPPTPAKHKWSSIGNMLIWMVSSSCLTGFWGEANSLVVCMWSSHGDCSKLLTGLQGTLEKYISVKTKQKLALNWHAMESELLFCGIHNSKGVVFEFPYLLYIGALQHVWLFWRVCIKFHRTWWTTLQP